MLNLGGEGALRLVVRDCHWAWPFIHPDDTNSTVKGVEFVI
jgi:hypothetical protein